MADLNIRTTTNANATFSQIRKEVESMSRVFRQRGKEIEDDFLGKDFTNNIVSRLKEVTNELDNLKGKVNSASQGRPVASPGAPQRPAMPAMQFGANTQNERLAKAIKDLADSNNDLLKAREKNQNGGSGFGQGAAQASGILGAAGVVGLATSAIKEALKLDEIKSFSAGLKANLSTSGERFGMSDSDMLEYSANLARVSGSSNFDALSQLRGEIGFGLGKGALNSLTDLSRNTGGAGSGADIQAQIIAAMRRDEVSGFKRESGQSTFVRLGESMSNMESILREQLDYSKEADLKSSLSVFNMFKRAGYEKESITSRVRGDINDSIRNPQNEMKEAFLLNSLRKANPNASYLELERIKDKGIYMDQDSFNQITKDVIKSSGGNDLLASHQFKELFGLSSYDHADRMLTMTRYGNYSKEDLANSFGTDDQGLTSQMQGEGMGSAGLMGRSMAQLNNAVAGSGEFVLDSFKGELKSILSDIEGGGIKQALSSIGSNIFSGVVGGDWESAGQRVGESATLAMATSSLSPEAKDLHNLKSQLYAQIKSGDLAFDKDGNGKVSDAEKAAATSNVELAKSVESLTERLDLLISSMDADRRANSKVAKLFNPQKGR